MTLKWEFYVGSNRASFLKSRMGRNLSHLLG
jgi:hypothetical protein